MPPSSLKQAVLGQGNQLQGVTAEELETRNITPLGGKITGANEHEAKMYGTPNQKEQSLRPPTDGYQDSLQRQQRMEGAELRTERNEAEQRAFEKSEYLKSLGHLGDRVGQQINSVVASLVNVNGLQAVDEAGFKKTGMQLAQGHTYQDVASAVNAFASGDQNALASLNQALGKEPSAPLTIEEIKMLYRGVDDSLAANIALQMPDAILVTDELAESLGYPGGTAELADLLGVTQAEVQNMSVLQLDEAAEALKAREFGEVDEIRARLNNPNLSSAERQALRSRLRALGASGVRATEDDVARTIERIEAGETIKFGDEEYSLQELLDDDEISGLIKSYLEDPEGTIGRTLPEELKAFINDNRAVLEDAADELDDNVTEFSSIQKDNLAIGQVEGAADIDTKVLSEIFGEDWDKQFRGSRLMDDEQLMAEFPTLALLHDESFWQEEERGAIVDNMNRLASTDPELAKQILQLTPQELEALGLSRGNNEKWVNFIEQRKAAKRVERLPDDASLDQILDTVFGKDIDTPALEKAARQLEYAKRLGIKLPDEAKQLAEWMNPGKLLDRLKASGSLDDIKKYKDNLINMNVNLDAISQAIEPKLKADVLYSKIWNYTKDGKIDAKNVNEFGPRLEYTELAQVLKAPSLTEDGRSALKKIMQKMIDKEVAGAFDTKAYEASKAKATEDLTKYLGRIDNPQHVKILQRIAKEGLRPGERYDNLGLPLNYGTIIDQALKVYNQSTPQLYVQNKMNTAERTVLKNKIASLPEWAQKAAKEQYGL